MRIMMRFDSAKMYSPFKPFIRLHVHVDVPYVTYHLCRKAVIATMRRCNCAFDNVDA